MALAVRFANGEMSFEDFEKESESLEAMEAEALGMQVSERTLREENKASEKTDEVEEDEDAMCVDEHVKDLAAVRIDK